MTMLYFRHRGSSVMAKLKHTFKTDILFRLLFTKYPHLLEKLIAQLLKIPSESIAHFEIMSPEMPPDTIGKKFCRLDILMKVDGRQVNLELQVKNEHDYPERTLLNWARIYSNALPVGDDYSNLPRTIVISIINFTLFRKCTSFHSEFQILEVTRNELLTDKMVMHFFELPKLPKSVSRDDLLLQWLALFKANTEEDLKMIEELGVSELNEAVTAYHRVTTSAEFQEMERIRIKASHDEAHILNKTLKKGEIIGEKRGIKKGEIIGEKKGMKKGEIIGEKKATKKLQGVIADKDAAIANKDAEIARLREELEQKIKQTAMQK